MDDIVQLIKDVENYDPSKVSDMVLVDDHRITHAWFSLVKQGAEFKYTAEQIKKLHDKIVEEMLKRGMKHNSPIELSSDYAIVHKGGEDSGIAVTLDDVLNTYEKPIILKKGFVKLVGGVANHGSSTGDIDLLIGFPPDTPHSILHPIKFRLGRAMDPKFASRIQFLVDEFHGPFTNHVDLYDLVLVPCTERKVVQMERLRDPEAEKEANKSREENKIKPLRFFIPLKGVIGYHEGEEYSIEGVKEQFKLEDYPLIVQKKYDGLRCVLMKKGDTVIIRSDDGFEVTSRFPTIVEEARRKKADFTLDAEVEGWKEGEHMGREEISGYVHAKTKPDDSMVVFNVFDILYFYCDKFEHHELKGTVGDLHEYPYEVRLRYLEALASLWKWQSTYEVPKVPGFNLTPSIVVEKPEELKNALLKMRNAVASEGAMVKSSKGLYPLTGMTRTWVKYKKSADIHAIVLEVIPTKTEGVWNYRVGVLIPPGWKVPESRVVEIKGKKYMQIGKTLNTKVKCNVGDIITVLYHTLFHYSNEEQYIMIYEPIFYERRPDQTIPDSATDAVKIAKEAGILFEKTIKHAMLELDVDLEKTLMDDKPHEFVMQHHYRGQSVHIDFRVKANDYLVGWTISDQIEGAIKEDVNTVAKAKELEKPANWGKYLKISNKPINESDWERKLLVHKKENEPVEWMDVEGVIEPGEVGATRYEYGVFSIFNKGTVEFGTIKPYFTEMFLHSPMFDGRWVMRQIPNPWKEEEPRTQFVWLFWKPIDQRPYVLTERAKAIKWVPPKGISALPKEIRDKIPANFKYWEFENESTRLEVRNKLIEEIKSGKIKLSDSSFTYWHQWWRGPVVIRKGPSDERYILELDNIDMILDQDIVNRNESSMVIEELPKIKEGEVKPQTELNPTKATPSWIEKIDSGEAVIYQKDSNVIKFKTKGKVLSGYFFATREEPRSPMWIITRVEGFPGEKI